MNFKYIYLYSRTIDDDTHYLTEIKVLNQPDDTPKDKIYYWLYLTPNITQHLTFVNMDIYYRKFKEGELIMTDGRM